MTMEQLALIIREERKKAGLSQGLLAETACYDQCSLSQFERGKKKIHLGSLMRIMDILGLKMKAGTHILNTPEEIYGIISSMTMKKRWGNKELSEASGIPVTTLMGWTRRRMPGVQVDNALAAMRALGLDVEIVEA